MPSDEASNTLAHKFEPLLHQLQVVDRREGGKHRVLSLVLQPPCREHCPGGLVARFPAHLELIDGIAIGQLLEESRAHTGLQAHGPGIGLAARKPMLRRLIGVQHLMARNGGHHHRNRQGFDQRLLRFGGTRVGGELLLHLALAIELRQHVVEAEHQAAARPRSATLRVACGHRCAARCPSRRTGGATALRFAAPRDTPSSGLPSAETRPCPGAATCVRTNRRCARRAAGRARRQSLSTPGAVAPTTPAARYRARPLPRCPVRGR